MVNRNGNGQLTLDVETLMEDFAKCKTENEIAWLEAQLQDMVKSIAKIQKDTIENTKS